MIETAIYSLLVGIAIGMYITTQIDKMYGSYLGPEFKNDEIITRLTKCGAIFNLFSENEVIDLTAAALKDEKAIGLMNGRMEFGPRALGARSIIADPRSPKMQKNLNLKVKFRESFRPFAPSVLSEDAKEWFDIEKISPYMMFVANISKSKQIQMTDQEESLFGIDKLNVIRSTVPAITHVDYSARLQTVHKETNLRFHSIISKFKKITGCPIVINTSFNIRGEPIVCTPEDAFRCFMGTELDMLVIGDIILRKEDQNKNAETNYKEKYGLD